MLDAAYQRELREQLLPRVARTLEAQIRANLNDRERLLDSLRAYLMLNLTERRDATWLKEWIAADWSLRYIGNTPVQNGLNEHFSRLLDQGFVYPLNDALVAQARQVLRAESQSSIVYRALQEQARSLGSLCYHYFCCKHGHSWQRQGSKAIARCACPTCAHTEKSQLKSLRSLRTIAVRHGGRCLSLSFESSHQRYRFCCAEGHTFELVGSTALRGSWCRQCANNSKMSTRMSELRAVCAEREGVCLSDTHASFSGLQRFRCQVGHEWDALPSSVLRGSWCRRCIIAKTRTLEAAQQQARYYGGQCLSLVYGGAQEKLQWTCGFGHFWSATLAIVRGGSWCRECRKSTRSSLKRLARFRSQNTPDS